MLPSRLERMPPAPYMAVLPQAHRLARKKRLRPTDFEGESFISLGHVVRCRAFASTASSPSTA